MSTDYNMPSGAGDVSSRSAPRNLGLANLAAYTDPSRNPPGAPMSDHFCVFL